MAVILLCAFSLSKPAFADIIEATFNGTLTGGSITAEIDSIPDNNFTSGVGIFTLDRTGSAQDTFTGTLNPGPTSIYAFCLDPQEFTPNAGAVDTWDVADLEDGFIYAGVGGQPDQTTGIGAVRANYLRELFAAIYPVFGEPISALHAAALQVVIWELVSEDLSNGFNLTAGDSRFSNPTPTDVLTLGQTWLDTHINDGVQGPMLDNLLALTSLGTQDLLVQVQANQIPAPSALWLMAIGLLWLGRPRRKSGHVTKSPI